MNTNSVDQAVTMLVEARLSGTRIAGLPHSAQPLTVEDAHRIQDATIAALDDRVAGWKVGVSPEGMTMRGALLESRIFKSGQAVDAELVPLLGVEAELAFVFREPLGPRDQSYTYGEVAAVTTAVPAIEIVDTRFQSYTATPLLHRTADLMSNGAFVVGTRSNEREWKDLSQLRAGLRLDGRWVVEPVAAHPRGDPLLPALDLVNLVRLGEGVQRGQIVTTGSYTGLIYAKPGQAVDAVFPSFGSVSVTLNRSNF